MIHNQSIDTSVVNICKRNSNIELLRIIAMILILISHSSVHAGFPEDIQGCAANRFLLDFLVLGNMGTDIFVLISGYVLCGKQFSFKNILKFLLQVWFYSLACAAVGVLLGYNYTLKELFRVFFPVLFKEYWFVTAYFVLLLLSPFINIAIKHAFRKQLLSAIIAMLSLWCIIPTFTTRNMYGTEIPQFLMLYTLGAYVKMYPDNLLSKAKHKKLFILSCFMLMFASSVILRLLAPEVPLFAERIRHFYSRTSIFIVGGATGLLCLFTSRTSQAQKGINQIASCMFGVYLIHENFAMKDFIWHHWFNNCLYYESPFLIFHLLLSVVVIFITCTFIEYLRRRFIEKPLLTCIYYKLSRLVNLLSKKISM